MLTTDPVFQFHSPTTGATHLVCHGCKEQGLPFGSAPLAVEPISPAAAADLTPEHVCAYCHVPLLPAGKLKYWLERLGFLFTATLDRSAWLQVRTIGGKRVVISVLNLPDGQHAPLDDDDGEVLLHRTEIGIPYLEPLLERAFVRRADVPFANLSTAVEQLMIEQEGEPHALLEKFLAGSRT